MLKFLGSNLQSKSNTPESRELFVGGLDPKTTIRMLGFYQDDFKNYFSQFGELTDCRLKEDKVTSKARINSRKVQRVWFHQI